ncbi:MAG: MerR family transcriptional regulator [Oleispira antarctica]|uniref:Probable transcriptional regulator, MerR family n=1 Tax=Oleispira antarctica RB-8 TaxID=698738 RepID=R4YRF1_OLEAN|nr:MerR family transcriptional regulator [Oleispira antarctica]MBQ0792797.1 MerR family transcriptional regulator [Oleispira antarctica]CCK77667.1 probable transcriptional regulator, MerR family [Oleispira antarctica RB-8]|tara:strand:+ start:4354 stop:4722 length:369 start_codon:yes stop_codon:yes gene_type:complete
MNIKQFSELVDVSAYTLRYYEKIGLLKNIIRNSSGHRYFTQKDVEWIKFVKRLKDTGMSLETIGDYADLRHQGQSTSGLRMRLLEEHTELLKDKIDIETLHLNKLKEKIEYYKKVIESETIT